MTQAQRFLSWGGGRMGVGFLFAVALGAAGCDGSTAAATPTPDGGGMDTAPVVHDSWTKLPPVPQPRFYCGAAAAGGRLYLIGGTLGGVNFDTAAERFAAHAFDPVSNEWTALPMLPIPMIMPNVAAVDDKLFILGSVDSPRAFTFDGTAWVEKAALPVPTGRGAAAVGVLGSKVLVAGGVIRGLSGNLLNTGVRQPTLLAYDTVADNWETLDPLPIAVGYAAGAVEGTTLWVIGGSTNQARTDQILTYDTTTKVWGTDNHLPVSVSSAVAGVIDGRLYVAGGIASSTGMFNPNTLVQDPATKEWATLAMLPTTRFAGAGGVLGGRLYLATGAGLSGAAIAPLDAFEAYTP